MSSNNRASLLSGLRTGGVRSSINPVPQTASPNFSSFPRHDVPMSASIDGSFSQYHTRAQAEAHAHLQAQNQALQMQVVQLEIMRLQALQAQQQYQIELAIQQMSQQQHVATRTSYPSFEPQDLEPIHASASRRSSQAEFLKTSLHVNSQTISEDQIPMSASLNGKFGARLNPNAAAFRMGGLSEEEEMLKMPIVGGNAYVIAQPIPSHHTAVISGGTSLGAANPTSSLTSGVIPSKSESSLNWRRGGNNLPAHNSRAASLSIKVTPPPEERHVSSMMKSRRPEPLRFSMMMTEPNAPLVVVDNSDGEQEDDEDASTSSSAKSEPTTPPSSGMSSIGMPSLSPREAASKRLYEGLGIGRPAPRTTAAHTTSFPGMDSAAPQYTSGGSYINKVVCQPIRQPRGPPSGADELGPKNFASRIRRKAIGGLGAMLDARVHKKEVEAY